jgi:hypothetical protein
VDAEFARCGHDGEHFFLPGHAPILAGNAGSADIEYCRKCRTVVE